MISLHYTSDRVTRFRCANTIIYIQGIPGSYGYRSLEIIYLLKIYKHPTDIPGQGSISDASTSEKLYNGEIKDVLFTCDGGVRTHADFLLLRLAIQRQLSYPLGHYAP